jgi:hypothetical protein
MLFNVTGISTLNGKTKVRFANDLVSRVKILVKDGHTDINLIELAEHMTKADCVEYLKGTDLYQTPTFAQAIDAADDKYSNDGVVKMSKPALSLDAIKARAGIVDGVDGVAVYAS